MSLAWSGRLVGALFTVWLLTGFVVAGLACMFGCGYLLCDMVHRGEAKKGKP